MSKKKKKKEEAIASNSEEEGIDARAYQLGDVAAAQREGKEN